MLLLTMSAVQLEVDQDLGSRSTGIWLPEALSVLDADFWRFYVYYTYALGEKDADFRWDKFADAINRHLVNGLQTAVERCRHEPGNERCDESARISKVRSHLLQFEAPEAFAELLSLINDVDTTRSTLVKGLRLLSCFMPGLAARAEESLSSQMGSLKVIGAGSRVDGHDLRSSYQRFVDERRSRQELEEEVTNMRADLLCVCPTSVSER